MRIAITGTRGIPNQYGGFEQFAEFISIGLLELGHQVWVYNPHFHSYAEHSFKGVEIVRKRFPEKLLGSAGNYLYDLVCIRDAIKRDVDIILECGYASAAPWYPLLRFGETRLITHMDGMERQREKWGMITRKLFLLAEKMAVRYSNALVCDHPEIARYYQERYSIEAAMITYGADFEFGDDPDHDAEAENNWDSAVLDDVQLKSGEYYLLVARLEPENKIQMIIEGFLATKADEKSHGSEKSGDSENSESEISEKPEASRDFKVSGPLVIIGNHDRGYGKTIYREFGKDQRLRFLGGVYDKAKLNNLRHYCES